MSDQLVAESAAYTKSSRHKRGISTPSAGFETSIPAIELQLFYALERTATGIGKMYWVGTASFFSTPDAAAQRGPGPPHS
jgi:hypothetical protein